jgi:low affinity Fe/Cu permease
MSIAASRGPLSSAISQWAVIGLGGLGLYGNENVCDSLLNGLKKLLMAGSVGVSSSYNGHRSILQKQQHQPQSIIIHGGSSASYIQYLVQWTMGAVLIWSSFSILQNILPDKVKEMLPVTRHVFDTAVTSLGNGIVNIRDVLSRQILGLEEKQDEFGYKLDETHNEVVCIRDRVHELNEILLRCEDSLKRGDHRQSFTAKGLRLLLKCVGTMLPANSKFHHEIDVLYNSSHGLDLDGTEQSNKDIGASSSVGSPGTDSLSITRNTPLSRLSSADTYTTFETSCASSPHGELSTSRLYRNLNKHPITEIRGDLEYNETPSECLHDMVLEMKKIGVTIKN